jgi:hypothetical protein
MMVNIPGMDEAWCILDYDVSLPGPGYMAKGSRVFCLTLGIKWRHMYSLVLRCKDLKTNTYERVGLMRYDVFTIGLVHFPRAWRSSQDSVGIEAKEVYRSFASDIMAFLEQSIDQADIVTLHNEWSWLVRLTSEQIATVKSHCPNLSISSPIQEKVIISLDDPSEGQWYLPPDEAEKKACGEEHKEFWLGKIVNIV